MRKKIKPLLITLVAIVIGYYLLTFNYTYWGEMAPLYARSIIGNLKPESDGIKLPSLPNPILNNLDLQGIDTDKNGIRDDLDVWAAEIGIDFNERMALRSVLKTEQELLKIASEKNVAKFQDKYSKLWLIDGCLSDISRMFGKMRSSDLVHLILKLSFNISSRENTYENIFSMDVFVYGPPDDAGNIGLPPHYFCDFELKDKNTFKARLEKIIKDRNEKEDFERLNRAKANRKNIKYIK